MKPDLVFGDVVKRRGVHFMVVDTNPSAKKDTWGVWIAGLRLDPKYAGWGVSFIQRAECKKVEP